MTDGVRPRQRLQRLALHITAATSAADPLTAAAAIYAAAAAARPLLTAAKLSSVLEWSHGLVDSGELPCGAVLVAHRGQVVLADAYGPSRPLESDEPVKHGTDGDDTLYRHYSMTKPIAAALAMVLVDEGMMALSDPLSKHLPAFEELPSQIYGASTTVQVPPTVKQLLQHRAGIYCPEFPQLFGWVEQQLEDFADPNARLAATVDLLAREPLVHEPGADFVYGIQYDVLGRLLEVVGGMPLDQLFQEKIFGPLCMERTTFGLEPELQPAVAAVFQPGQGGLTDATEQNTRPGVATCHPLGYFCAGEGLQGTMEDFYRFAGALANGGAPPAGMPGRDDDGIGSAGEYGWGGAAATVYWADPVEELVVLYFTQVLGAKRGPKEELRRLVYQALRDEEDTA